MRYFHVNRNYINNTSILIKIAVEKLLRAKNADARHMLDTQEPEDRNAYNGLIR